MRPWLIMAAFALTSPALAQSEHELYASQCVEAIEEIADFSCADGVIVPVTVNGVPVTSDSFEKGMSCDHPGLLFNGKGSDGQCVPGSRILNLSTETAQVSVMCRQKHNRPEGSLLYDEIDVIAHNPASGATCWFMAKSEDPASPIDGELVRSPTASGDQTIWADPEIVVGEGCGNCHDNDPFMYSPFVGQVWAHVPANPLGPYFHVGADFGFGDWPTETFNLRDNTCLGCHRIGKMETCAELTDWMTGKTTPLGADAAARQFPMSHSMPPLHGLSLPAWRTFHGQSVAEIKSCCDNPEQSFCQLTDIPAYRQ